ncbi:hypothetical protein LX74_03901 [Elizabethkingia miricola]|uniref:Uncharacterized protein n=1 Tax=Elizabethkingia miricola TaxID=172045 RepID=A0ABY3NB22_ELIMR|nr:hypothetical protein LX74_03901 [Elizabethkingia miricola]
MFINMLNSKANNKYYLYDKKRKREFASDSFLEFYNILFC